MSNSKYKNVENLNVKFLLIRPNKPMGESKHLKKRVKLR